MKQMMSLEVVLAKNLMIKELLEIFHNSEREKLRCQKQRWVQDGGVGEH